MDAAHLWGLNQAITSSRCSPTHSFNGTSSSLGEKKPLQLLPWPSSCLRIGAQAASRSGRMFMSSLVRNHR